MCFFPGGGFQNVLVPPNDRARRLADYLRVAIAMHFLLAIFMLLGGRWFDGAFDLVASAIGYMSIRQPDAFSIQQLLCYCIFCGMDFFWAVIRVIMFVSNVTNDAPSKVWQFYIYVGTLIAAPLVYILCTYLAYQVYKELKNTVNDMVANMEAGNGVPPAPGVYGQSQAGGSGSGAGMWSHPEAHPSGSGGNVGASGSGITPSGGGGRSFQRAPGAGSASSSSTSTSGYVPFSGPGYKLGGT